MKYLEGIIHIVIGILFLFFRVVDHVSLEKIYEGVRGYDFYLRLYQIGDFDVSTYSLIPYLLGVLFITLGVIKLREVIVDG